MQKRNLKYAAGVSAAVSAALILVNCSGGSVDDQHTPDAISQAQSTLAVTGISSTVVFSFDLGVVDPATHMYYVTDRTNKSITGINLTNNTGFQFKPAGVAFAGCNSTSFNPSTNPLTVTPMPGCTNIVTPAGTQVVNNDASGPDGLDIVGPNLYAGDVNALWILDKGTGALVKKIVIPSNPTGLRADEGCFDKFNNLYAIATPGDNNPFMTIIDTVTQLIVAKVVMDQPVGTPSGGLEACFFDSTAPGNGTLWLNNDGSTVNPDGEVNGISVASLIALKPGGPAQVVQFTALANHVIYPLPALCSPTGIAQGPGNHLGAMCRPGAGAVPGATNSLDFVIMDRTAPTNLTTTPTNIVATVVGAGGGDQIAYDPVSNKWYLADSRSTPTRKSCGAGTATCPLTPKLGVVNAAAPYNIVAMIPTGNNSHSVAVDSGLGKVISPFTNPSATGGGSLFPNGGINIFATR